MLYVRRWDSPLGEITLASNGNALVGLWFEGQKGFPVGLTEAPEAGRAPALDAAERWLGRYFSGREPECAPRLAPAGTPFQRAVWEILTTIPYGATMTYGEIAGIAAARLMRPRVSARAVGGAVGRNPISILIPCHRVVGADGSLTGYAGGLGRKAALLRLERDGTEMRRGEQSDPGRGVKALLNHAPERR